MKYPLLPRWVLTNPLPAFYDIESTSSVQMTAKLYKHIQGLTDDYNKFADEINKAISDHINEVNADQECFEAKINKIIHDYIITIDLKIAHQDREIDEAIEYMKTNLSASITELTNQMKESGEFDEAIAESFNELNTRVEAIETNLADYNIFKESIVTRVSINESEIATLKDNVNTLKDNVNTLEETISSIDTLETYSTEETVVGEWLGKKLYRRIFSGPCDTSDSQTISPVIPNIEFFTKFEGILYTYYTEGLFASQIGGFDGDSPTMASRIFYTTAGIKLSKGSAWCQTTFNYNIIVEYVKSTD